MHIPDALSLGVRRWPDDLAIRDARRRLSFIELDSSCDAWAFALKAKGVLRGDRICFVSKNRVEFAEAQFACQRIGAIFVPLNYRLGRDELDFIFEDSTPRIVFFTEEFSPNVRPGAYERIDLDEFARDLKREPEQISAAAADRGIWGPDAGQMIYTSGTTGRPKGVVVSNMAMYWRMASYAAELRTAHGQQLVQTLPMFHLSASFSYAFLFHGGSSALVEEVSPSVVWRLIEDGPETSILLVPTVLEMLLKDEALAAGASANLTTVLYGASAMPAKLLKRASGLLRAGFTKLYGLTEAGAATSVGPDNHRLPYEQGLDRCVGYDMIGFETAVLSPQGETLGANAFGEICIRGPAGMTGYWNDPVNTASALWGDWVRTGDGGYRGDDGRLFLSDRLKDIIISGGENVSAAEVEHALLENASIAECTVIGLPDERLVERVHAVVVPVDPDTFSLDDLDADCKARFAGFKRPRSWTVTTSLPRNNMGKVMKPQVRAMVRDAVDA